MDRNSLVNKKGIAIVTVLSVVALLMVMGAIGSYVVRNESQMTKNGKDVNIALKAAEGGIEKAAARIKNGIFDNFTGTLKSGAIYTVTIVQTNCPSSSTNNVCYTITSTGAYNDVSREIQSVLSLDYSDAFKSFAADKKVTINTIDLATPPDPSLDIYAGEGFEDIDSLRVNGYYADTSNINDLTENSSYSFHDVNFYYEDTFKPSVGKLNYSINTTAISCDYGSFGSDITINTNISDSNVVICGDNVTINDSINTDNLTVYALNDITVNDEIYKKGCGGMNESFNVTLVALDDITFGSNGKISIHSGHESIYNITIYAGGKLDIETSGSGGGGGGGCCGSNSFIDVNGGKWATQRGGILIAAKEGITQSSTADFLTMRGNRTGDLFLWSDGDIDINEIYMWGKKTNELGPRTIGGVAYSGNIEISGLDTTKGCGCGGGGGSYLGGLTLDNLTDWAERASGPAQDILQGLLQQIGDAINNGELKPSAVEISSWKTY